MNRIEELKEYQIEEIKKLAKDKRIALGFTEEPPIANHLNTILDKLEIILVKMPIEGNNSKPSLSAIILNSKEGGENLVFIGVNSADYYDKQLFAISHELYHYFIQDEHPTNRAQLVEAKANYFAAEFLLPETTLKRKIFDEFKSHSLKDIDIRVLLRFIARMHCTWWLPYRSLVKRLWEIEVINENQYQEFYNIDERNLEGEYGKIGMATTSDIFLKLNTMTNTVSSSPIVIETIIRNFEDNLIDEESFIKLLGLFNKNPADYGYDISVLQEDLNEIDKLIEGWADESWW